jgi:hypothetical protein
VTAGPGHDLDRTGRDRHADALGEIGHRGEVRRIDQDDRHLLTARAGHGSAPADRPPDPTGHLLQHEVARGVPVRVVDRLEVVDVERDQTDAVAHAPVGPGRPPAGRRRPAVVEPGQ